MVYKDKHSSLFAWGVSDEEKKFWVIDFWGGIHNTIYDNLTIILKVGAGGMGLQKANLT
jgi:hypothetical protein